MGEREYNSFVLSLKDINSILCIFEEKHLDGINWWEGKFCRKTLISTYVRKPTQSPQVREGQEARAGVEVRGKMGRKRELEVGLGVSGQKSKTRSRLSGKFL